MTGKALLLTAAAALLVVTQPLFAHHGGAAFDDTKSVTFTGTVTEMNYSNPHVLVYWDVTEGEAAGKNWSGWLTAPNKLNRAGWTRKTLQAGDKITVTGTPHKSGLHIMFIRKLVGPDGNELRLTDNL